MLPAYFAKAIEVMERHRNVAFVFPVLQGFGEHDGIQHGTDSRRNCKGECNRGPKLLRWKCCLAERDTASDAGHRRDSAGGHRDTRLEHGEACSSCWMACVTAAMYRCCTVSTQRR